MKFINFFLCLWVIFAFLDPDPIRIRIHITGNNLAKTTLYRPPPLACTCRARPPPPSTRRTPWTSSPVTCTRHLSTSTPSPTSIWVSLYHDGFIYKAVLCLVDPGSRNRFFPDPGSQTHIFECLTWPNFWVKSTIILSVLAKKISLPRSGIRDPGSEWIIISIRDPGSATLVIGNGCCTFRGSFSRGKTFVSAGD